MRADLPSSHSSTAMDLSVRAYVDLFEIMLTDPDTGNNEFLYLCDHPDVSWNGKDWEKAGVTISDYELNASGQMSRPKFSIVNPGGTFTRHALNGNMDNATVNRFRVIRPDLEAGNPVYQFATWRMAKFISGSKSLLVFELRSALDGPTFYVPPREFRAPEFPTATIN